MKYLFWAAMTLGFAFLACGQQQPAETTPGASEFQGFAKEVITLLETGDAVAFTKAVCATEADWEKLATKAREDTEEQRKQVQASAEQFLKFAREIGLDAGRLGFAVKEVKPAKEGKVFFSDDSTLPYVMSVDVILSGGPKNDIAADAKWRGDYHVAIRGLYKFPVGWRTHEGVFWVDLPDALGHEERERELAILSLVAARKPLTGKDDPALERLGNIVLTLLKTGNSAGFLADATEDPGTAWKRYQEEGDRRNIPLEQRASRKAFDKALKNFSDRINHSVKDLLTQASVFNINFTNADVELKSVGAEQVHDRQPGTLEGVSANSLSFVFEVLSNAKSKTGTPISGEYVIRAGRAKRNEGKWTLENSIGWKSFPNGVVDEKALAAIEFENHIAKYGTLPPGTLAPDIDFVLLENDKKVKLADYRDQVVLLDFWATWCGPCQKPMAELQKLVAEHPQWKGRATLFSLSIDTELPKLREHLQSRGWTNSVNAWAGAGGWEAQAPKAFRVRGVPTTYIIGKDGKVLWAGHPSGSQVEQVLKHALQ